MSRKYCYAKTITVQDMRCSNNADGWGDCLVKMLMLGYVYQLEKCPGLHNVSCRNEDERKV